MHKSQYHQSGILFLFILLNSLIIQGQNQDYNAILDRIDSIQIIDPNAALDEIKDIKNEIELIDDNRIKARYYKSRGSSYRALGDLTIAYSSFVYADSILGSSQDERLHISIQYGLANILIVQKNYDESQAILNKVLPIVESIQDTTKLIDWYCHMARTYINQDLISEGLDLALKAYKLNQDYKGDGSQAFVYKVLADAYFGAKEYEKSVSFYEKNIQHFEKIGNKVMLIPAYINVSNGYARMGDVESALKYLNKVKDIKAEVPTDVGYFTAMLNRTMYLIEQGKYKEAKVQSQENLDYAEENDRDPAHALYWMGVVHRGLDQYNIAEKYIQQAFEQAKSKNNKGPAAFYAHALYQTFLWGYKYESALEWYETHIQYRDSIMADRQLKDTEVLMAKIEALEKQKELDDLERETIKKNQRKNIILLSLLFTSLLGLVVIYALINKRKRERKLAEEQYKSLKLEKDLMQKDLEFNEKQLTSQVLNLAQKNTFLISIKEDIEGIEGEPDAIRYTKKIIRKITRSIDAGDQWDEFLATFTKVHNSFLQKLKALSEGLTSNDIRLASLLKMNMSSKDIAGMLNISDEGVKKARYRLRKKLNLDPGVNIQDYLLGLG